MKMLKYLPLLGFFVLAGVRSEDYSSEKRKKHRLNFVALAKENNDSSCEEAYRYLRERAELVCYENHQTMAVTSLVSCTVYGSGTKFHKTTIEFYCE